MLQTRKWMVFHWICRNNKRNWHNRELEGEISWLGKTMDLPWSWRYRSVAKHLWGQQFIDQTLHTQAGLAAAFCLPYAKGQPLLITSLSEDGLLHTTVPRKLLTVLHCSAQPVTPPLQSASSCCTALPGIPGRGASQNYQDSCKNAALYWSWAEFTLTRANQCLCAISVNSWHRPGLRRSWQSRYV